MDDNKSFDSSKESVTRFSCEVVVCNSLSAWCRYLSIFGYMKKLKEKLIQRIKQVEKELTNKLDILVQENTKFQLDEISKVYILFSIFQYTLVRLTNTSQLFLPIIK
jgi:hypothetical protein